MKKQKRLLDEYRFPGFRPQAKIQGVFGDQKARIIRLERTQKKRFVDVAELCIEVITIKASGGYGIYPVEMPGFIWKWMSGEYYVEGVEK